MAYTLTHGRRRSSSNSSTEVCHLNPIGRRRFDRSEMKRSIPLGLLYRFHFLKSIFINGTARMHQLIGSLSSPLSVCACVVDFCFLFVSVFQYYLYYNASACFFVILFFATFWPTQLFVSMLKLAQTRMCAWRMMDFLFWLKRVPIQISC